MKLSDLVFRLILKFKCFNKKKNICIVYKNNTQCHTEENPEKPKRQVIDNLEKELTMLKSSSLVPKC